MMRPTPPILRFDNISKRFGGTQAVDQVSLELHNGEVLALLGENGAGKSTLIKILAGVYAADQGRIWLNGQPESQWRSNDRQQQPIAFIHQDLGLVEWMTVTENVALGIGYPRLWNKKHGLIDWKAANIAATRVLARVGCQIDPQRRLFSLTRAEKALLAIGRALEVRAQLLVLDEPSASLPAADVARLFSVLNSLRSQGMGMIYVSHRLDEIMHISDRCAVMRDGQLVAIKPTKDTSETELIELIVGTSYSSLPTTQRAKIDSPVPAIELKAAAAANAGPLDLKLYPGEILGLVGLRGAGQDAIGRALFGCEPLSQGMLFVKGKPCVLQCPAHSIEVGIGYTAGERLEQNLAVNLTVQENLFPNLTLHGQRGLNLKKRRQEKEKAKRLTEQYDINPRSTDALIQQLSGGNQQKVVLARWFALNQEVLILEEPTAGVDVGAKRQIYELIRSRANAGCAIAVVSSDFDEITQVCSRVLVFRSGAIAAELVEDQLTLNNLLAFSAGSKLEESLTE
jgi:ribose transport system ATP-binding protein